MISRQNLEGKGVVRKILRNKELAAVFGGTPGAMPSKPTPNAGSSSQNIPE
jgi:hypothetical protein